MNLCRTLGLLPLFVVVCSVIAPTVAADERGERVDQLFSAWNESTPGAVVAVAQGDEVLHFGAYGLRNVASKQPVTRETRFYLASASKQFTAACIADLAQQGQLSLNDSVRKYIPQLPEYADKVSLLHLIHHRSGLRDIFELMSLAQRDLDAAVTPTEVLDLVCRQQSLQFEPGESFSYSNTNYFLLAEIVERVSGVSLRDYAEERIFAPLGMEHTEFRDSVDQVIPQLANGHENAAGGYRARDSKFCLPGSGGLYSTVDDVLRWQRNLATGEWGGRELMRQLQTPPDLTNEQRQSPMIGPYAFGLIAREYRGLPVVVAPGGSFGYGAMLMRFPEQDLSIIVMANSSQADATDLGFAIADIYLGDQLAAPMSPEGEKPQPRFALFRSDDGDILILSARPTGEAHLTTLSYKVAVQPSGHQVYVSVDAALPVTARFKADGSERIVEVQVADESAIVYRPLQISSPGEQAVSAMAGTYFSEEIGAEVTLKFVSGRLVMDDEGMEVSIAPFMPISADLFLSDTGVTLEVLNRKGDNVSQLVISTPRARGIVFDRK